MNYSKQLLAFTLLFSGMAFGSQPQIPSSSLPKQTSAAQPTITATIVQPRETLSTETALLFDAINKNDTDAAKSLFSKLTTEDAKALANSFDSRGWSALMRAVKNDKIVHLLLEHGANVNQTSSTGIPPLREAMIAGNIDTIKELIRNNANVNQADNYGITPLMMAVSQGPAQAAFNLIEAGADVNAEDRGGQTVWKYSNFSSPRKVSAEQKAEIQRLLEAKNARKTSIRTGK